MLISLKTYQVTLLKNKVSMASEAKTVTQKTKINKYYSMDKTCTCTFVEQCYSLVSVYIYQLQCILCNVNVSCAEGGFNDVKTGEIWKE